MVHYDLCWNPTRHEQREGRVDRFGQDKPEVRVLTFYGRDNPIDGVILDVLLRKHKSIKSDLGVSVSVPGSSEEVAEALFEGALFREMSGGPSEQLGFDFGGVVRSQKEKLHQQWEDARDKEKASRSRYAQRALKPELVAAEMNAVRQALGSPADVELFFRQAMAIARVPIKPASKRPSKSACMRRKRPRALRQALQQETEFTGRFDLPLQDGEIYLGRTSPVVEGLAGWVLDQALDPAARDAAPVAARCGILRTRRVTVRTTLLVARFRYHLKPRVSETSPCFARRSSRSRFTAAPRHPNGSKVNRRNRSSAPGPTRTSARRSWISNSLYSSAVCRTCRPRSAHRRPTRRSPAAGP